MRCVDRRYQMWGATIREGGDNNRPGSADGGQQAGKTLWGGVEDFDFYKGNTDILKGRGGMNIRLPFNKRRGDTIERDGTVGRYGNMPIQGTAAHGFDSPERFGATGGCPLNIVCPHYPRGKSR